MAQAISELVGTAAEQARHIRGQASGLAQDAVHRASDVASDVAEALPSTITIPIPIARRKRKRRPWSRIALLGAGVIVVAVVVTRRRARREIDLRSGPAPDPFGAAVDAERHSSISD